MEWSGQTFNEDSDVRGESSKRNCQRWESNLGVLALASLQPKLFRTPPPQLFSAAGQHQIRRCSHKSLVKLSSTRSTGKNAPQLRTTCKLHCLIINAYSIIYRSSSPATNVGTQCSLPMSQATSKQISTSIVQYIPQRVRFGVCVCVCIYCQAYVRWKRTSTSQAPRISFCITSDIRDLRCGGCIIDYGSQCKTEFAAYRGLA